MTSLMDDLLSCITNEVLTNAWTMVHKSLTIYECRRKEITSLNRDQQVRDTQFLMLFHRRVLQNILLLHLNLFLSLTHF